MDRSAPSSTPASRSRDDEEVRRAHGPAVAPDLGIRSHRSGATWAAAWSAARSSWSSVPPWWWWARRVAGPGSCSGGWAVVAGGAVGGGAVTRGSVVVVAARLGGGGGVGATAGVVVEESGEPGAVVGHRSSGGRAQIEPFDPGERVGGLRHHVGRGGLVGFARPLGPPDRHHETGVGADRRRARDASGAAGGMGATTTAHPSEIGTKSSRVERLSRRGARAAAPRPRPGPWCVASVGGR